MEFEHNRETVVILRGFYLDDRVLANIEKLHREVAGKADFFFLYDIKPALVNEETLPKGIRTFAFHQDRWVDYKRPDPYHKTFIPGNEETMFLMFFDEFPQYKYYWFIEYDAEFTGDWWFLIGSFEHSSADLLASSLTDSNEFPEWGIWKSLTPPEHELLHHSERVRCFLPVCRFSAEALRVIRRYLKTGWSGHPEALIASILKKEALLLEDIGGDGPYTRPENKNRFYTSSRTDPDLSPGTLVFRPKFAEAGDRPNTIWHPVKLEEIEVWDTLKPLSLRLRYGLSAGFARLLEVFGRG